MTTTNPIAAFEKLITRRATLTQLLQEVDTKLEEFAGLKEQFEKDSAFRNKVNAGLSIGTQVVYEFGRAQTRITKTGVIKAFKAAEGKAPAQYRIESGEGFDASIDTVPSAAIVDFPQSPAPGTDANS